jgi:hypothetical protein
MLKIRKRAAELIVEEINTKGSARVHNLDNCIRKVKEELGINLEVNESGNLIKKL